MLTLQKRNLAVDDQVVIALRRISQAVNVWSRALLHEYGLTSPQLALLRELIDKKSTTGELANTLHLSQPTVTGILTRLEQRGLVRRERSETDRRSVRLDITDQGRELAEKAPPLLRDRFRHELATLSGSRQLEILDALQQVAEMMQAPEIEGPFFYHD